MYLSGKQSKPGLFDFALKPHNGNFLRLIVVAVLIMAMPAAQAENLTGRLTFDTLFQPLEVNETWQEECAACHIAYPPGLLQAESWIKIMKELGSHFGVDASLTAKENQDITEFLVDNASLRWIYPTPPLRISETEWFKRAHRLHEHAWKNPKVKSASNCFACHTHAEHGDFFGGGGGCGGVSNCHSFNPFKR